MVRRAPLVGTAALLVLAVAAIGWYIHTRQPTRGTVRVYDAATGHKLWSRTTDGGYVVVLAVTPGAALVADADDCIHGKPGAIELLTPKRTTFVASASACEIYRFTPTQGVFARHTGGSHGHLLVVVPSRLGRGEASLPCPCPASAPDPNGAAGSPVNRGAYARVELGSFVAGAD